MSNCIIIAGNPVDGFNHYGPFDDCEQANEWADGRFDEWWGAKLHLTGQEVTPLAPVHVVQVGAVYDGNSSRGVKLEAAFTGDPGEYQEIRVDAYGAPPGVRLGSKLECLAGVVVGVDALQEVRVLITTKGEGDGDHHVIVYPERSEDIVEFD